MEKKLVFDVGMHIGQDTINYLKEGFKVVAVEANPQLVEQNTKKFKKYIDDGSLIILNVGISDKEGSLPFYVNKQISEWSSFDFTLGSRNNTPYEVVNVPCETTANLFKKYGTPYFLKVDIEGLDYLCIHDLPEVTKTPNVKYVSCEASEVSLLDSLHDKGYTKFKIIHQSFHFKPLNLKLERNKLFPLFLQVYGGIRIRLGKFLQTKYPYSSSGPIPEKTEGEWLTYTTARTLFTDFNKQILPNNNSWFDFHATY